MTIIDAAEWASPPPSGGHQRPSPFHGDRRRRLIGYMMGRIFPSSGRPGDPEAGLA